MSAWPENVLDEMEPRVALAFSQYAMVRRPVAIDDPALTIGMFTVDWNPVPGSHETGQEEATLSRYTYRLQLMVKHADRAAGINLFSLDTKVLRGVLYRDATLQVQLHSLSEDILGFRERFQRFRVTTQRYMNNEIAGSYVFLSSTTCIVETETGPVP